MDAEVAAQFAAGATATTVGEFRALFYKQTWEEYLAERREDEEDEEEPPSPDEPFSFGEWMLRLVRILPAGCCLGGRPLAGRQDHRRRPGDREGHRVRRGVPRRQHGCDPRPDEALDYLASKVDPDRDGFTLERDDEAVQAAWPQSLFESDLTGVHARRLRGGPSSIASRTAEAVEPLRGRLARTGVWVSRSGHHGARTGPQRARGEGCAAGSGPRRMMGCCHCDRHSTDPRMDLSTTPRLTWVLVASSPGFEPITRPDGCAEVMDGS